MHFPIYLTREPMVHIHAWVFHATRLSQNTLRKRYSTGTTHHMTFQLWRSGQKGTVVPLGTGLWLLRLCHLYFSPTCFPPDASYFPLGFHALATYPLFFCHLCLIPLSAPNPISQTLLFSFPWWEHTHELQYKLQLNTPKTKQWPNSNREDII